MWRNPLPSTSLRGTAARAPSPSFRTPSPAPLPFTDGALVNATMFSDKFPYLQPPLGGAPNDQTLNIILQSAARVEGPYRPTSASFDTASKALSASAPDAGAGFFRLLSDGRVKFDSIRVVEGVINLGIGSE